VRARLLWSCNENWGSAERGPSRLGAGGTASEAKMEKSKQQRASKFLNLGREEALARKERGMQCREGTGGQLHPLKAFAASSQLAMINCGQSAISSLV